MFLIFFNAYSYLYSIHHQHNQHIAQDLLRGEQAFLAIPSLKCHLANKFHPLQDNPNIAQDLLRGEQAFLAIPSLKCHLANKLLPNYETVVVVCDWNW